MQSWPEYVRAAIYSYGPYSYGLYSFGRYSHGPSMLEPPYIAWEPCQCERRQRRCACPWRVTLPFRDISLSVIVVRAACNSGVGCLFAISRSMPTANAEAPVPSDMRMHLFLAAFRRMPTANAEAPVPSDMRMHLFLAAFSAHADGEHRGPVPA